MIKEISVNEVAIMIALLCGWLIIRFYGSKNNGAIISDIVGGNYYYKNCTEPSGNRAEILRNKVELTTDPTHIHFIIPNNQPLSADFCPKDLVVPNVPFAHVGIHEKNHLRQVAATALENLFQLAKEEGIQLIAVSGFRSYEYQKSVFHSHVRQMGLEEASRVSAVAGYSEHQLGLAMDITSASNSFSLSEAFGETLEGIWLKENAHRAGFIVRYLEGKEHITGFSYEPWHIRYIGNIAEEVFRQGVTLEEFFGLVAVQE